MLSGEATNTNLIVFGLTRSGLEHTIYRNRDEHTNNYTTMYHIKNKNAHACLNFNVNIFHAVIFMKSQ